MMGNESDLVLLQGYWQQYWYERDGIVNPIDEENGWRPLLKISEETFTVTIADGSMIIVGEFVLDQGCQPKAIDWIDKDGPYATDHPILGIYTLTETEFTFCASYDGTGRPSDFVTMPGQVLRRMRRAP